jgi:four helix bundle protein
MLTTYDNLRILKQAEELGDESWKMVEGWDIFARDTVGKQFVRAADSVGANIPEMHGRFNYGEKIQFLYYARGSLFETKHWLNRVSKRKLAETGSVEDMIDRVVNLAKQLKAFIASTKSSKRETNYKTKLCDASENTDDIDTTVVLITDEDLAWLSNVDS